MYKLWIDKKIFVRYVCKNLLNHHMKIDSNSWVHIEDNSIRWRRSRIEKDRERKGSLWKGTWQRIVCYYTDVDTENCRTIDRRGRCEKRQRRQSKRKPPREKAWWGVVKFVGGWFRLDLYFINYSLASASPTFVSKWRVISTTRH